MSAVVVQAQVPALGQFYVDVEHSLAAAEEVAGVLKQVKAYQIAAAQGVQDRLPVREHAVDLGTGEGVVQEKADVQNVPGLARDKARQKQQLGAVDPDHVAHVVQEYLVCEDDVHALVGTPQLLAVWDVAQLRIDYVVQDLVEDHRAEALVHLVVLGTEEYGDAVELLLHRQDQALLLLLGVWEDTGKTEPYESFATGSHQRVQLALPHTFRELELPIACAAVGYGYWKLVGYYRDRVAIGEFHIFVENLVVLCKERGSVNDFAYKSVEDILNHCPVLSDD